MIEEALVHTSVRTDRNLLTFLVTSLQSVSICGLSEHLIYHHASLSVITPDGISHFTASKHSNAHFYGLCLGAFSFEQLA